MRSPNQRFLGALALSIACAWPALHATTAVAAPVPSQQEEQVADPPGRVGRISEVQGQVWLYHPDEGEWMAAELNRPLTSGDRLATDGNARSEVRIGSTTLRLDGATEIEVLRLDDDSLSLQLHAGSLAVRVRSRDRVREFELLTGEGRFTLQRTGRYRFDRADEASFVTVLSGRAYYEARNSALTVNAGQRAEFWLDRGDVPQYSIVEPERDSFSSWVAERDRADDRTASTRYVSPEMTGVEDLDRYGYWQDSPEYGALWVPRVVAPGWAPYTTGRWVWVAPWGWTWVDEAPWGFAPFHYGRWVYVGATWCWSPGTYVRRPVYAPALVAWIGGPRLSIGISVGGGSAVGWVPLAPREVYVPTYRVSPRYVRSVNVTHVTNITNITTIINNPQQAVADRDYRNRKFPHAVTVVPTSTFAARQPVAPAARQLRDTPAVREIVSRPTRGAVVAAPPVAAPTPAPRRSDAPVARPPGLPATRLAPALREQAPGFQRDRPDVLRPAPGGKGEAERQQERERVRERDAPRDAPRDVRREVQPVPQPQTRPAPQPAVRPVQPTQPARLDRPQQPERPVRPQQPERPLQHTQPTQPTQIVRPQPHVRPQPQPQDQPHARPQPSPQAPPATQQRGSGGGAGPALRERPDVGNGRSQGSPSPRREP